METVQKRLITVETTLTSSPLDESLSYIEAYLNARLAEWSKWALTDSGSEVTTDLGALGAGEKEKQEAREWKSKTAVYSLRLCRSDLILGPLYRPTTGKGLCPMCLERRWRELRVREMQATDPSQQLLHIFGHSPWITPFALESLWAMLGSILQQKPSWAALKCDQISCLHLDTLTLNTYQLIPDPCCPICSKKIQDTPEALVFSESLLPKSATSNYRLTKPSEYTLSIDGYLNPVCGMLGATAFPDHINSVTVSASGKFDVSASKGP